MHTLARHHRATQADMDGSHCEVWAVGDASASLALVERRFTTLPTRPKGAMSPRKTAEDVVTGARAIEMLGNVMNTSGELRMGVANAMGELAVRPAILALSIVCSPSAVSGLVSLLWH